jgi:hypothetical protein
MLPQAAAVLCTPSLQRPHAFCESNNTLNAPRCTVLRALLLLFLLLLVPHQQHMLCQ